MNSCHKENYKRWKKNKKGRKLAQWAKILAMLGRRPKEILRYVRPVYVPKRQSQECTDPRERGAVKEGARSLQAVKRYRKSRIY